VEGWVEVVLLAGFRNMTALTSDLAVIVEALRASKNMMSLVMDSVPAWSITNVD